MKKIDQHQLKSAMIYPKIHPLHPPQHAPAGAGLDARGLLPLRILQHALQAPPAGVGCGEPRPPVPQRAEREAGAGDGAHALVRVGEALLDEALGLMYGVIGR